MSFEEASKLLESVSEGALGTVENGKPFVSATGCLFESGKGAEKLGSLYFLLSDLARHTKNLNQCPEASFLMAESKENTPVYERKRLSLQGKVTRISDPDAFKKLKGKYLERFPKAEIFFTLADFRFYEMPIESIHWIAGFGKAGTVTAPGK